MDFCPMCRKILVLGEWKNKRVAKCSCGFIRTAGIDISGEEKMNNSEIKIGLASEEVSGGYEFLCKKCGYNRAEAKELGEILGNEKSVTLFTCLKCGNVERE